MTLTVAIDGKTVDFCLFREDKKFSEELGEILIFTDFLGQVILSTFCIFSAKFIEFPYSLRFKSRLRASFCFFCRAVSG